MFLKENHKPRIITTLNETITNEQTNELLWKVIYFDNFINFNDEEKIKCFTGFVPNQYGNTIFILENGEYKSKSRRPLIPFWYDDKYFYC